MFDPVFPAQMADEGRPVRPGFVAEAISRRVLTINDDNALKSSRDRGKKRHSIRQILRELLATGHFDLPTFDPRGETLPRFLADFLDFIKLPYGLTPGLHDGVGEGVLRVDLGAGHQFENFVRVEFFGG